MSNLEIFPSQDANILTHPESAKQPSQKDLVTNIIDTVNNTSLHIAFMRKQEEKVDNLLGHLLKTSYFVNMKNKYGLSYLHIASARGNVRLVRQFLNTAGANAKELIDKDCPFCPNYSPLQFACDSKSIETIKILIKASNLIANHVKVNNSNTSVTSRSMIQANIVHLHQNSKNDCNALSLLHLACIKDNPDVIDNFLAKKKIDINEPVDREAYYCSLYTPLHFAVEFNCKDNVKYLLKKGAYVECRNGFCMTPLHLAMYHSNSRILELLYDAVKDKRSNLMDMNGLTYLHIAAAMNDMKTVKKLLVSGVDINQAVLPNPRNFSNYTPLHFAVRYGHQKMVKLLHIHGADLNTNEGVTPLQTACEFGHISLIQYLIKHSANATVIDPVTCKTTLHLLVQNLVESEKCFSDFSELSQLNECIKLLMKHNIDVNAKDSCGNTVLHVACKNIRRSEFCAEVFLDCGADINIKSDDGRTPLDVAWDNSFKDCNYESLALLYHHVQKLIDLGLYVDINNEEFCQKVLDRRTDWSKNKDWVVYKDIFDDDILEAKHLKRIKEIEKIRNIQIDADISLYDFLKFDVVHATNYVSSDALKKFVEDSDFWVKYPSYAYLIRNKREKVLAKIKVSYYLSQT